ncbi:hypothetical protein JMUB5695_01892 [Mycobacterium heckeshornense]|uniref:hypothetical protein n=1 Tax=Mycobacterium heckeshornense TaxID=110505 RepID=UPI001941575B|nr:hypothetical protein [Mycobacterium heckeshornense]BCQ08459.1 hypothetical protein JMUB5695_01892 [Mycobacterium heckeshornense]
MTGTLFDFITAPAADSALAARAATFCESVPYRVGEFSKRNWGGPVHSLCSYQGKLKPSIAHFLVSWFTEAGERVLDPLAGVGTIPLEARRQGRTGIASDLSPLADTVCRAKLEPFNEADVWHALGELELYLKRHAQDDLSPIDVKFGLNGPICDYFHDATLREIVLARQYFLDGFCEASSVARDVIRSNLLHILHGNRPYALSRRSHPVTPFAPTGPAVYRSVIGGLRDRLDRVLPDLLQLRDCGPAGAAYLSDFRALQLDESVDAVITSPPFSKSLRFWSSNWMRLWFAGWSPADFKQEPSRFLEVEQRKHFDVYTEFAQSMARLLKPGGLLIMHLGETSTVNMATSIQPRLDPFFDIHFAGRESVSDTETHGLRDKGATVAHWYLFATAKR